MWLRSGMTVTVCRPAAAAPIQLLAWELLHDADAALKSKKKKNEREREKIVKLNFIKIKNFQEFLLQGNGLRI